MNKIDPKIEHLIYRFLRGELPVKEREVLDEWLEEGNHRQWFERICDKENMLRKSLFFDRLDKGREKTWRDLERKTGLRRRAMAWRWAVAASLVVPLLIGLLYQAGRMTEEPLAMELKQERIIPGVSMAQLCLPDGRVVNLNKDSVSALHFLDGGRFVNEQGTLSCQEDSLTEVTERYSELHVPRGGEYKVVLSDGTTVWLNAESSLRFPNVFRGRERKVYAKGELYFEVKRDAERPFVVEVDKDYSVEVLGTEFNLRAYGESPKATTLVRGSVRVKGKGNEVVLKPREQACETGGSRLEVAEVDVAPYMAWKEGKFYFMHVSLKDIMEELGRWYDVNVVFENEAVANEKFTIEMKRFDDFSRVLKLIEKTGMVTITVDGHSITVK